MKDETIEEKQSRDESGMNETDSSPEQTVEISKAEFDELKQKAGDAEKHHDQLLRAQANLDNYRKRAAREKDEIIQRANEHLVKELLAVIDHFEIGLQSAESSPNGEAILDGMRLIHSQIETFLTKLGIEPIDAVGREFDPTIHEAVAQEDSDEPAGRVIRQIRKGYKLKGHILRPAAVVVSKDRS